MEYYKEWHTIYIDRDLNAALWNGRQISVPMAECIVHQFEVLGSYTIEHNDDSGLYFIRK